MIESGHLILTMMPSLYCKLDCPHCYLSKEQRRDKTILSVDDVSLICKKIYDYYATLPSITDKKIDFYWYGGEPTSMGVDYFEQLLIAINNSFDSSFKLKHILLSALVGVTIKDWTHLLNKYFNSTIQTSYDSTMRGERYMSSWKKKVIELNENNINVITISVINSHIVNDGAEFTHNLLSELSITQSGWLPFQKNTRNDQTGMFDELAPTMNQFSEFMINLTKINRFAESSMLIGEEKFIYSMSTAPAPSNMGLQTLFLLPDGTLCMPDYDSDNVEFLLNFGNILEDTFQEILTSNNKRVWNRRQITNNQNIECISCEYKNYCIMEFWKKNTFGDDCYGAKKYIKWLFDNQSTALIDPVSNFS
jgi:radical SAM protein with 4Fe4S-binding SPASM domain